MKTKLSRTLLSLLLGFVVCFALGGGVAAQSLVGAKFVNKTRTEFSVSFDQLTFYVVIPEKEHTQKPLMPKLTLDLYDEDGAEDDGVDTNKVETDDGVTIGEWNLVPVKIKHPRYRGPARVTNRKEWRCKITVGYTEEQDVTDPEPGDKPDPVVKVIVQVGKPGDREVSRFDGSVLSRGFRVTYNLMAPDLPSVSGADFGIDDPRRHANSERLAGEPITALSRGLDPISQLPDPRVLSRLNQAALYFVSDQDTQVATGVDTTPGQVFVLDAKGDLWPEEMYAADLDPTREALGTPRYLNLNTAPAGGAATEEIYFALEGSDDILYAPTGDPAATSLYLDVAAGQNVTGLAVEDLAPRGAWSAGDRILFALEGSSAIYSQSFGAAPLPLSVGFVNFAGATTIGFDHFDRSEPQGSLQVGNIRALAVSMRDAPTPEPADRVWGTAVDAFTQTYGAADGGHMGFRGAPKLGASDFYATLHGAAPGTMAQLFLGDPIDQPGITLPPALSSSKLLLDINTLVVVGAPLPTAGGFAELALPVPNDPRLVAWLFGFQWAVFDPATLPLSLSDAGLLYARR